MQSIPEDLVGRISLLAHPVHPCQEEIETFEWEPRCVQCGAYEDRGTCLRVCNGIAGDGQHRCQFCAQAAHIRHCGECGEENTDLLNDEDLCFCCVAHHAGAAQVSLVPHQGSA